MSCLSFSVTPYIHRYSPTLMVEILTPLFPFFDLDNFNSCRSPPYDASVSGLEVPLRYYERNTHTTSFLPFVGYEVLPRSVQKECRNSGGRPRGITILDRLSVDLFVFTRNVSGSES